MMMMMMIYTGWDPMQEVDGNSDGEMWALQQSVGSKHEAASQYSNPTSML